MGNEDPLDQFIAYQKKNDFRVKSPKKRYDGEKE
jgi:hypothetical protein